MSRSRAEAGARCPVCRGGDVRQFLRLPAVPVFCNQLCHSRQEALDAPTAAMELGFCGDCGHIFNTAFDPAKLAYSPEYENSLHFSPVFQRYAEELADGLARRYRLTGRRVVEIGCGSGDFLKSLCRAGDCRGFGFDVSFPGEPGVADPETGVVVERRFYRPGDVPDAALICCRHVLEHIAEPRDFLRTVAAATAEASDATLFFEVPNALYTLRDGGIWDLIYEHCGYFSPTSLARAFAESGFAVQRVEPAFGGQFLTLHATRGDGGGDRPDAAVAPSAAELAGDVGRFAEMFDGKIRHWRETLAEARRAGRKVVLWGAGSKGNTFLNVLDSDRSVEYIVDINPRKHGKFVAGTGQQIVPPAFLQDYGPDLVVLMNPIYRDEIVRTVQELGLQTAFADA